MTKREELIQGYAESLFSAAQAEGDTARLEEQFFALAKALATEAKVRDALGDTALPVANKRKLLEGLLGARASAKAGPLLGFVLEQGRARELPAILERFVEVAAASRDEVLAEVRSAVPLDGKQQERLAAALGKAAGRAVDVRVVVDPTVIGGVVAKVGDQVFDSSVRARLQEVRDRVSGR